MMSDSKGKQRKSPGKVTELSNLWGFPVDMVLCEHCDWRYLVAQGTAPGKCPHCFQQALTPLDSELTPLPADLPPELVLPFVATPEVLERSIIAFAGSIPFAPRDLNSQALHSRLQSLYLPMWLVDAEVRAVWQMEAGFDYEAVSHQERYADGDTWREQEVSEQRIRWEVRSGRLVRTYNNVPAPALGEHSRLTSTLGTYELSTAHPYAPETTGTAWVRLPNRSPDDAWPDAIPTIRQLAAQECQAASGANHQRDFRWTPQYGDLHWTQVLLPAYATYYLDDQGVTQPVMIHGQTGKASGARRSSTRRAQSVTMTILAVALAIGAPSLAALLLGGVVGGLSVLGVLGLLIAIPLSLGSVIPLAIAWNFNRSQARQEIQP